MKHFDGKQWKTKTNTPIIYPHQSSFPKTKPKHFKIGGIEIRNVTVPCCKTAQRNVAAQYLQCDETHHRVECLRCKLQRKWEVDCLKRFQSRFLGYIIEVKTFRKEHSIVRIGFPESAVLRSDNEPILHQISE